MYDRKGIRKAELDDADDLVRFLSDSRGAAFTSNLNQSFASQFLPGLVDMDKSKVLSSEKGKPVLVRIQAGRESRWISSCDTWNELPEPELLDRMWDIYEHAGVGFAPSPSSLGARSMRNVYAYTRQHHHSCPSLACEDFLHAHSCGSTVWYPGIGHYDKIQYMDMKAAFIKHYTIHPDEGAVTISHGHVEDFATYFCKCKVTIPYRLSLGPFPLRVIRGKESRTEYPIEPGVYDEVYLWKEQVDDCQAVGCTVEVSHGFGWRSFTTDNLPWARYAYWLRSYAPTEDAQKKAKVVGVSGIGHHGMKRERYVLVPERRRKPTDRAVLTPNGEPTPYYITSEVDNRSAYMVHWQKYTEMQCKRAVYNFALPYAIAKRLVSIDFDAIMVLEGDDRHEHIQKYSVEDAACPPGSWLWRLLHNVEVIKPRTFESDEMTRKPGVKKDVIGQPIYA